MVMTQPDLKLLNGPHYWMYNLLISNPMIESTENQVYLTTPYRGRNSWDMDSRRTRAWRWLLFRLWYSAVCSTFLMVLAVSIAVFLISVYDMNTCRRSDCVPFYWSFRRPRTDGCFIVLCDSHHSSVGLHIRRQRICGREWQYDDWSSCMSFNSEPHYWSQVSEIALLSYNGQQYSCPARPRPSTRNHRNHFGRVRSEFHFDWSFVLLTWCPQTRCSSWFLSSSYPCWVYWWYRNIPYPNRVRCKSGGRMP